MLFVLLNRIADGPQQVGAGFIPAQSSNRTGLRAGINPGPYFDFLVFIAVGSATVPTYIGGHGGPPYCPKKMASNFMKFHTRFQRIEDKNQMTHRQDQRMDQTNTAEVLTYHRSSVICTLSSDT